MNKGVITFRAFKTLYSMTGGHHQVLVTNLPNGMIFCISTVKIWGSPLGSSPDQSPDAVQLFVFELAQVRVVEPLITTLRELAVIVAVGAAGLDTSSRLSLNSPLGPIHVSMKVASGATDSIFSVPDMGLSPNQSPDA